MSDEPDLYLSDVEQADTTDDAGSIGDDDAETSLYEPPFDISGKKCWDVGMASEEGIEAFMAEDDDNIVFVLQSGNAALCISRSSFKDHLVDDKANYYYLCRGPYKPVDGKLPIGVYNHNVCQTPIFGLGFTGMSSQGLVFRENIVNAINDTSDRVFVVRPFNPPVRATSVAGVEYLRAGSGGQGTISSMHCQPDTGDELYYITASKANIVPSDLQKNIDTMTAAGCLIRQGEEVVAQTAYDGRPASAEVEAEMKALQEKTDFEGEDAGDDDDESYFDDEEDGDQRFSRYARSLMRYDDEPAIIQTINAEIAYALDVRGFIDDISPSARETLELREHAIRSLQPYVANYFVVLLNGLREATNGLAIIQTTKLTQQTLNYTLKPIYKIDNFPPAQPDLGVAFNDQTLAILDRQISNVEETLRGIIDEAVEESDGTNVNARVSGSYLLMGQTDVYRKQEILMMDIVCVSVDQVMAPDGKGFDNDETSALYYEAANRVLTASRTFLADPNPLTVYPPPRMPPGMQVLQIKMSLISPIFSVLTLENVRVPGAPGPLMRTEASRLGNAFLYLENSTMESGIVPGASDDVSDDDDDNSSIHELASDDEGGVDLENLQLSDDEQ